MSDARNTLPLAVLAYGLPALAALAFAASAVGFDGSDNLSGNGKPANPPAARKHAKTQSPPSPDAEAAGLAFVREHHPELAGLLAQLKPMKPAEYQRAVRELAQVSKNLAAIKARNPQRYELSLNAWKAKSRVELLTAKMAGASGAGAEFESQLHRAVEDQFDSEVRQQTFERDLAAGRVKKLKENLDRLESRRDSLIESRYNAAIKKGQRARQWNETAGPAKRNANAKASTSTSASTKSKPPSKPRWQDQVKLNPGASSADSATTTTKGDRQP